MASGYQEERPTGVFYVFQIRIWTFDMRRVPPKEPLSRKTVRGCWVEPYEERSNNK